MRRVISITLFLTLAISLYGQEYGFMYMADKSGTTSIATATWHTVGSGTENAFSEGTTSTNWTYSYNNLRAGASLPTAIYLVKFSLSFGAGEATWEVGISKNGDAPSAPVSRRTISSEGKDAGVVYGVAYMSLAAEDSLKLCVQQESGSAQDFDPVHAQVVVVEMTDNTPNYYGGMKIENNSTAQTGLTNGSYTQLTGFSLNTQNNDWTVTSDELIAGSSAAGTYLVSFSMSYAGDGSDNSPPTFDIGIAQGTGTDPTTIITRRKTSSTDVGNIGGIGILSISASDKLRLEVKPTTGNAEITPYYSSITLYKLSGTSTAPRAHMEITSDQDQTISASSTYVTITGFSGGSELNDWTFSSNSLNATSGTSSAGNYLVDYSVSFKKKTGEADSPIVAAFAVFLGSTQQTELTIKRKLSGNSDVGAAGGTGIININSATTLLTLQAQNETDTDDLTIKSCTVNLHRFVTGSHDGSLPVELLYFDARSEGGLVYLDWETGSEIDNLGFMVERRVAGTENWQVVGSYLNDAALVGLGSSTSGGTYGFIDRTAEVGVTYDYRLADIDYNNEITTHKLVSVTVVAEDMLQKPTQAKLVKAYPNPFNPTIEIQYFVPEFANHRLDIYDAKGRLVHELVGRVQSQGERTVTWDGRDAQGNILGAGVYFLRLTTEQHSDVQKIVFLK